MSSAIAAFRTLHESGCFVIPNPWDVGSAVLLHRLGFKALATSSAGLAFTHGLPDAVDAVPLDATLAHVRDVVAATPLPVSVDFQAGFANDLETLAANVISCVETGAAGLSIEDATGDREAPLYDRATAIERVRAARQAIDRRGIPVVLTARCEAWLVGDPEADKIAIDRCIELAAAGADCVFAPKQPVSTIATLVRAVAPTPVNVIVTGAEPHLTVTQLADLGVRRISIGSALARVAWGAALRAARGIAEGSFEGLADAAPFATLNDMFGRRA